MMENRKHARRQTQAATAARFAILWLLASPQLLADGRSLLEKPDPLRDKARALVAGVQAFLEGHIAFGQISDLVEQAMRELPDRALRTLHDAQAADAAAREFIRHRTGGVALGT